LKGIENPMVFTDAGVGREFPNLLGVVTRPFAVGVWLGKSLPNPAVLAWVGGNDFIVHGEPESR
jgi:hypothetical protein